MSQVNFQITKGNAYPKAEGGKLMVRIEGVNAEGQVVVATTTAKKFVNDNPGFHECKTRVDFNIAFGELIEGIASVEFHNVGDTLVDGKTCTADFTLVKDIRVRYSMQQQLTNQVAKEMAKTLQKGMSGMFNAVKPSITLADVSLVEVDAEDMGG
jgi:hypothetical protein